MFSVMTHMLHSGFTLYNLQVEICYTLQPTVTLRKLQVHWVTADNLPVQMYHTCHSSAVDCSLLSHISQSEVDLGNVCYDG